MSGPPRRWFWRALAHQRSEDAGRCIWLPLGQHRVAVCSRCAGVYPALVGALTVQLAIGGQALGTVDLLIALGASLPAFWDWARSRLGQPSSNAVRVVTGVLLGVGLSRSGLFYLRDPAAEVFWIHAMVVAFTVGAVEFVRALKLGDL